MISRKHAVCGRAKSSVSLLPLAESVALYKEGLEHAAACREQLEKARHDIRICSEGMTAPFEMPEADE